MSDRPEDAWLFPGDYITSDTVHCGTCGQFDHNDGDEQCPGRPVYKPLITVHTFRGGGPTARVFEQKFGPAYMLTFAHHTPRLQEVLRIDYRMFPPVVNGNRDPSLVIRLKGGVSDWPAFMAYGDIMHKKWLANDKTWLALRKSTSRGYDPEFAVFGENNGRQRVDNHKITGLRLDGNEVRYLNSSSKARCFRFDWLFNYSTSQLLVSPPQPSAE